MKNKTWAIGLLQALGLVVYCSMVATVMNNAERWFGKMDHVLGPVLFLSLFVVSALICGSVALGYPFLVLWEQKNTKKALKIVGFTIGWLMVIVVVIFTILGLIG